MLDFCQGTVDFQRLFEKMPGNYLVLTPDFRMVAVTDDRLRATMTTREDTIGRNLFEVFTENPEDPTRTGAANLRASLERVLTRKMPDLMPIQKYDVRRPDELGGGFEERYWKPVNTPILDEKGEVMYILHYVEDVTELQRKGDEVARTTAQVLLRTRELGNQEAFSDRIIDNSPTGIIYVDRDLVIRRVNPTITRLLGLPAERMVNRRVSDVFPDLDVERQYGPVLKRGETVRQANFEHHYEANGKPYVRYWDFVNVPTYAPDGGITGVLGMAIEVSDRVEKERLAKEQIEAMELTDRMKDDWLAMVSHELRTPLNFITGFTSILKDELAGPVTETQCDYLDKIQEGSDRMLALVDQLLDTSRLMAGKFTLEPVATDYRQLVHDTVSTFVPLARAKHQSLAADVQVTGPITLDGRRIAQVLTNLLANAVNYTPEGGAIHLQAYVRNGDLVTEVTDTGIGIAQPDLPNLFKRFGQLDMSSTRSVGGTGLGLTIAKGIVEAHGGQIGVRSEGEGKGSTFWFTLPFTERRRADGPLAHQPGDRGGARHAAGGPGRGPQAPADRGGGAGP